MTKVSGSQGKPKSTKTAATSTAAAKTKYAPASEKSVSSVVPLASATAKAAPETAGTTDSPASDEAVSASPVLVTSTVPVVTGPELKKRELLERVVTRSGVKKRDAKLVVEAMLAVMGEALAEGEELNLPPFGKLKINRVKESPNGRILNCKLRQGVSGPREDKEGLAEADD
ncbi:MAG: HU family DNA-binding protein [Rhodobacterales bacterium]